MDATANLWSKLKIELNKYREVLCSWIKRPYEFATFICYIDLLHLYYILIKILASFFFLVEIEKLTLKFPRIAKDLE